MSDQKDGMARWEMLARGAKGDKGERGEKGTPGIPPRQRRAVVYLFVLNLVCVAICFWWLSNTVTANARQRCASISQIVTIPIPIPVAGNPSRQAWSDYEHVERRRGDQLGCSMPPPRYVSVKGGNS